MDCQEYLCGACVESHNSFTVLDGHTLVGKSHAQYGNTSKTSTDNKRSLPSVPTERCELHSLKLVDMYCVDHDSVGCHACFTISHKSCQGIHYIPEEVQTIPQAEQSRKIKEEMEKAIPELDGVMKQKQKDIEDNRKTKAIHIEEIKAFREEIN
ncbi:tripartite motif-containing protein 66-like [Mercenaria mercenaria]|uniref:tripartite motif-containing protein 66-like n=1 Tax=Mercenaria mercenaria TaxID=6596 RepID=UPI00234E8394|nr:tripartite motif-containing protein 66-like [Mercenaria mercenaria]